MIISNEPISTLPDLLLITTNMRLQVPVKRQGRTGGNPRRFRVEVNTLTRNSVKKINLINNACLYAKPEHRL